MKLGILNTLTQQIIDKTIQEAQILKQEVTADDKLKKFFAKLYKEENLTEEDDGNIENIINTTRTKIEEISGKNKPAMGLQATEQTEETNENKKSPILSHSPGILTVDKAEGIGNMSCPGVESDIYVMEDAEVTGDTEAEKKNETVSDDYKEIQDIFDDINSSLENAKSNFTKQSEHLQNASNSTENALNKINSSQTQDVTAGELNPNRNEIQTNSANRYSDIYQTIIDMANGSCDYNEDVYNSKLDSIDEKNVSNVICRGGKDFTDAVTGVSSTNKKILSRAEADTQNIIRKLNDAAKVCRSEKFPTLGYDFEHVTDVPEFFNPEFQKDVNFNEYKEQASDSILYTAETVIEAENLIGETKDRLNVNGQIDEKSIQQTSNCWVHSGYESLSQTEEGKKLISENISRDAEKGITKVHLEKAQKDYEISDKELVEGAETQSEGDADMTAYSLAIDKYLKETKQGTTQESNTGSKVYEIMTGKEAKCEINVKDGNLPDGISRDVMTIKKDSEKAEIFDAIVNQVEEKSGACNISVNSGFQGRDARHAISIKGVDSQGRIIAEESNHSEEMAKSIAGEGNYKKYQDSNGEDKYEIYIDKKRFEEIAVSVSSYKYSE